jgi:hypothetical protein
MKVTDINTEKIDAAVLAEKGYISDPVGKAKSVLLTEEGLRESERLFAELFGG